GRSRRIAGSATGTESTNGLRFNEAGGRSRRIAYGFDRGRFVLVDASMRPAGGPAGSKHDERPGRQAQVASMRPAGGPAGSSNASRTSRPDTPRFNEAGGRSRRIAGSSWRALRVAHLASMRPAGGLAGSLEHVETATLA